MISYLWGISYPTFCYFWFFSTINVTILCSIGKKEEIIHILYFPKNRSNCTIYCLYSVARDHVLVCSYLFPELYIPSGKLLENIKSRQNKILDYSFPTPIIRYKMIHGEDILFNSTLSLWYRTCEASHMRQISYSFTQYPYEIVRVRRNHPYFVLS